MHKEELKAMHDEVQTWIEQSLRLARAALARHHPDLAERSEPSANGSASSVKLPASVGSQPSGAVVRSGHASSRRGESKSA